MANQQKPLISFIGSGKVATQLAKALAGKGYPIHQVISRHLDHARSLADSVNAPLFSNELQDLKDEADIFIIAVKDDVIQQLIESFPFCLTHSQVIVHTSGTFDENRFSNIARHFGCLYPLQTFQKEGTTHLNRAPFFISGESEGTCSQLKSIAVALSEIVLPLDHKQRQHLHVAAVFANNFTIHLLHLAKNYCQTHQLDFDLLWPLIQEGIENARKNGPRLAQTGPALRHDEATIQKHEFLLSDQPELQNIYHLLTASIQKTHHINEDS